MINLYEVKETNQMIEQDNLDVRTITLGISLMDCIDADLDRLIFEHYLAFADEPRTLSYKDGYGRIHDEEFSRYDFLTFDLKSGKYVYDDDFLFSVDLNGGAEYQREALWERNLENLRSGALGDPSAPMTLLRYWQCQERAHYPFARENVEFFSEQFIDLMH